MVGTNAFVTIDGPWWMQRSDAAEIIAAGPVHLHSCVATALVVVILWSICALFFLCLIYCCICAGLYCRKFRFWVPVQCQTFDAANVRISL